MSVNKAILIGRLGKDPELKYTDSGKAVCRFSLATTEKWTTDGQKQEKTTWHNIVAWGKQAEVIKEFLVKGREVYIEGRIDNRTYEKKDGGEGYISEVIVSSFQFIGPKETAPGDNGAEKNKDDDLPF